MSYKVLIVEDDPMVSMINEQYVMKNPNFTIAGTCRNGQEAINFLETQKEKVDLILLDVYMPVMDGRETLKSIRNKKFDTEVIMVTAANDNTTIEDTMHLGVMDYLIKPFAYERFNISLEKFLSKKTVMESNTVFDQHSIDKLISSGTTGIIRNENTVVKKLPKGIQQKTLFHIREYFENNLGWNTVDMIAEKQGISVVTVRNYLNYMVKEKIILEDINYSTGGRPSMLYKINNE